MRDAIVRQRVSSLVPVTATVGSLIIIWRRRCGNSQDNAPTLLVCRSIQRLVNPISPYNVARLAKCTALTHLGMLILGSAVSEGISRLQASHFRHRKIIPVG
jgi:hypothetical protein